MRKISILLFSVVIFFIASCGDQPADEKVKSDIKWSSFGEKITADGAIEASELPAKMGSDSLNVKVHATVEEVCQKKGCWMTTKVGDKDMRIRFKDYGFFMPKDCSGKEVIFEGKAFYDTTTVEMLKHYAMDGGKSKEEIEKITEPEINLSFLASGVLLKENSEEVKKENE